MIDIDGRELRHGDRVIVYRPGVTEVATVREPDSRLGLSTPVVIFAYDDGFSAAHGIDKDGYPVVPDSWRVVKGEPEPIASRGVITERTTLNTRLS